MTRYRYVAEPSPRLNPEGRLDLAWRIRKLTIVNGAVLARFNVVATFSCDGRDACERWAADHSILLST